MLSNGWGGRVPPLATLSSKVGESMGVERKPMMHVCVLVLGCGQSELDIPRYHIEVDP